MKITIELPDQLYSDLAVLSRGHDQGYGPENYAADLVCSELASRRLACTPGKTESHFVPAEYRVRLPEKRV